MKNRKRFFCLLTLVLFSLALLAGCGSPDSDLHDTDGIIYDYDYDFDYVGAIVRNGEQIEILVYNDQEALYIYYDDNFYELEEPKLLDKAELPTHELHDTDWYVESVYTDDITGDNNGDLAVTLRHADDSASYIVWTWEKDKGYVYQPDDSWFYDPGVTDEPDAYHVAVEGLWLCDTVDPYYCIEFDAEGNWKIYSMDFDRDVVDVADEGYLCYVPEEDVIYLYSNVGGDLDGCYIEVDADWLYLSTGDVFIYDIYYPYEGLWLCETNDQCDYLEFDAVGNWKLWFNGDLIDEGDLWCYEEMGDSIVIHSEQGSDISAGGFGLDGDRLWFSYYGYFDYLDGRGGQWQGDGGSNWDDEYRGDSEVYHQDISAFEGTWYFENDLSAEAFIMIDGDGNWSLYQRTPGEPDAVEIDCGTFSCSTDETATYHANSSMYDGVWYEMYDLDEGVLLWDGDTYYRLDD